MTITWEKMLQTRKTTLLEAKYVKFKRETLKFLFTSNYWCLCQKICLWNICFEKKPKEFVIETFKV